MKKFLVIITVLTAFAFNSYSQHPYAIGITTGCSRLTGFAGVDGQFGIFGLSTGWMPRNNWTVQSFGFSASVYSGTYTNHPLYISYGYVTNGYRVETNTTPDFIPMHIGMFGCKGSGKKSYWKFGVGIGWGEEGTDALGEATFGWILFKGNIITRSMWAGAKK